MACLSGHGLDDIVIVCEQTGCQETVPEVRSPQVQMAEVMPRVVTTNIQMSDLSDSFQLPNIVSIYPYTNVYRVQQNYQPYDIGRITSKQANDRRILSQRNIIRQLRYVSSTAGKSHRTRRGTQHKTCQPILADVLDVTCKMKPKQLVGI